MDTYNNQEENNKKVRTLDLIMAFMVTLSGALFFLCITRSLNGDAIFNPWISAMICAMIFEMFLVLFSITVGVKKMIIPITIIAFLPSIIFLPVVWHMVVVALAIPVAMRGLYMMRRTLFNGLKIDVATIVRSGIAYVSFALVVVVTSQYYFFIKDNTEVMFDANSYVQISNVTFDYILKTSNIENVSINTMTVDDFLQFMMDKTYAQEEEQGPKISSDDEGLIVRWADKISVDVDNIANIESIEEEAENVAFGQMRANISNMIGREVRGDELMSDVLSEIISVQVDNAMTQNVFLSKYKTMIFTALFFLIVFSLASIVRIMTGWSTRFVFMLLREFKIIHVEKIQRDAEVIVL
ncbi:MAG: hypothetical protein U9Q12_03115 [Patescibacteria group bacterium]|nr:hypothetical protein [Patescibacteria group bacterium]